MSDERTVRLSDDPEATVSVNADGTITFASDRGKGLPDTHASYYDHMTVSEARNLADALQQAAMKAAEPRADVAAALIAAERVRDAEAIRDHATQQDEARTQSIENEREDRVREEREAALAEKADAITEARTQPEWGDREEALRRKRKAADKRQPETGQPENFLYDAGYGAGVRDAEARIVALIESVRKAEAEGHGDRHSYAAATLTDVLSAIQEDTDED